MGQISSCSREEEEKKKRKEEGLTKKHTEDKEKRMQGERMKEEWVKEREDRSTEMVLEADAKVVHEERVEEGKKVQERVSAERMEKESVTERSLLQEITQEEVARKSPGLSLTREGGGFVATNLANRGEPGRSSAACLLREEEEEVKSKKLNLTVYSVLASIINATAGFSLIRSFLSTSASSTLSGTNITAPTIMPPHKMHGPGRAPHDVAVSTNVSVSERSLEKQQQQQNRSTSVLQEARTVGEQGEEEETNMTRQNISLFLDLDHSAIFGQVSPSLLYSYSSPSHLYFPPLFSPSRPSAHISHRLSSSLLPPHLLPGRQRPRRRIPAHEGSARASRLYSLLINPSCAKLYHELVSSALTFKILTPAGRGAEISHLRWCCTRAGLIFFATSPSSATSTSSSAGTQHGITGLTTRGSAVLRLLQRHPGRLPSQAKPRARDLSHLFGKDSPHGKGEEKEKMKEEKRSGGRGGRRGAEVGTGAA
eukprot:763379-Hanusia_phi.AAC.1